MSGYYDYIIVGAGASGLMLAAGMDLRSRSNASESNAPARGLILEKTGRPGTKLLMSGGGRCNITHGGSIKDFIGAYGPSGKRLRTCLYRHSNIDLASWLEDSGFSLSDEHGVPVYSYDLSDAGRIFPASMKSSEVLELLLTRSGQNGWDIRTGTGVYDLQKCSGMDGAWEICTDTSGRLRARNVVIATGGITYPETGSDGSLFDMLRSLGVNITELRSALAPIYVDDYPYEALSGISISGVTVTIRSPESQRPVSMTGDLLFTHQGFSGPAILNISRYAEPGSTLSINYNRDLSELPKRMQHTIEDRSRGPSGDIRTRVLSSLLTADEFTVSSVDEHGMVTSGGISLDEIDMKTMQLTGFPGLYAIGEAIDADGITGGYNLQMCWSTARTAADTMSAL